MAWLQLRVFTRTPEFAEELLTAHGAAAVSFIDGADTPILEPTPGQTPFWPDTISQAYFKQDHDLAPVLAALREAMPEGAALRTETVLVEDRDWVRLWLEHWPVQCIGERLWVVPRAKRHEVPDDGKTVLLLDPGLAFGTGTHPSTWLCLEWLTQQDLRGRTVLDYGCGSGILAIAALLLGAERAVGVDIDPQALTATLDNAAVNGVADRVEVMLPEAFTPAPYQAVLANILANPLIALAPKLAECTAPGGVLALAGLLDRQSEDVRAAYAPYFELDADGQREGWNRVNGRRR